MSPLGQKKSQISVLLSPSVSVKISSYFILFCCGFMFFHHVAVRFDVFDEDWRLSESV